MSSPVAGRSPATAVLVAGAGPVGLVLACELLRRGVPVRVVDASAAPGSAPQSRAVLLWPRTLELLRGIEAAEPLTAAGHQLGAIGYRSDGRLLGTVRMGRIDDTPYPYAVTLPQYETERILLQRLAAYGGDVERGTAIEAVIAAPDGQSVSVLLRHPGGEAEQVTADWLVGADGAHSTVRKEMGIAFTGDNVDVTFGIADVGIQGQVARDTLHYCYTRDGALGVVPLPGDLFRVAVSIPHRDPTDPPSAGVFRQALQRHAPGFGELGEPRWTGSFRVRCRIAESFRQGRVLLAGDAAHVISPAGGQGMNLGIQDAVNLGWKLAGVARGNLADGLLDSYHTERRAAAQRVASATAAQTRWGLVRGRLRIIVRDTLVRLASASGALQKVVAPLMAQTDVRYDGLTPLAPHHGARGARLTGMRLPVFPGPTAPSGAGPANPFEPVLAASTFTVLDWLGASVGTSLARQSPEAMAALADRAVVTPVNSTASPALGRSLYQALGRAMCRDGALITVRPDGHVAFLAANTPAGARATTAFLDSQVTTRARTAAAEHAP